MFRRDIIIFLPHTDLDLRIRGAQAIEIKPLRRFRPNCQIIQSLHFVQRREVRNGVIGKNQLLQLLSAQKRNRREIGRADLKQRKLRQLRNGREIDSRTVDDPDALQTAVFRNKRQIADIGIDERQSPQTRKIIFANARTDGMIGNIQIAIALCIGDRLTIRIRIRLQILAPHLSDGRTEPVPQRLRLQNLDEIPVLERPVIGVLLVDLRRDRYRAVILLRQREIVAKGVDRHLDGLLFKPRHNMHRLPRQHIGMCRKIGAEPDRSCDRIADIFARLVRKLDLRDLIQAKVRQIVVHIDISDQVIVVVRRDKPIGIDRLH